MTSLVLIFVAAVIYGKIEAEIFRGGWLPRDDGAIFGMLSWTYHAPAFLLWFLVCFLGGYSWVVFSFAQVEDLSYFVFNPKDRLTDKSWVTGGLGGFTVFGRYIPFVYLLLHVPAVVYLLQ